MPDYRRIAGGIERQGLLRTMRVYFGFDDTDNLTSDFGTGKLVRWFQDDLPEGCTCRGVVRQQLKVCDAIPYTSHNSAACLIADIPDSDLLHIAVDRAVAHILRHAAQGSDPGLCVVTEGDAALDRLTDFGHRCAGDVVTQHQAVKAAGTAHLSGHGGTNDGIIGAAAAVGLTASGWAGRFIAYNGLRCYPGEITVAALNRGGVQVISVDRDAGVPGQADCVSTNGWLRPRLLGGRPVVLVAPTGEGRWRHIHRKRRKMQAA
jgi:hypothetical protein